MIVKPAISFLNDASDSDLVVKVKSIIAAMTLNAAVYPTPSPKFTVIEPALQAFMDALAAANDGGKPLKSAKNAAREQLAGLIRQLASYVTVTCGGDMEKLLQSGFPIQKPTRSPIGILPAPGNLTLTLGLRSGELIASANPVNGAAIYNWVLTLEGQPTPVVTTQTTAASITFTDLLPGKVYTAEVNAVGAAGPSDWSDAISQMVV